MSDQDKIRPALLLTAHELRVLIGLCERADVLPKVQQDLKEALYGLTGVDIDEEA